MAVITGPRKVFVAKMARRGYTLEEVAACIVSDDGMTIAVDVDHAAYPRDVRPGFVPPAARKRLGLGDMVAAGLSSVGVTKDRVSRVLGKPCGCEKRQALLNKVGRAFGIGLDS